MNFYASRDYLDAIAEVYFPGRQTTIGDVAFGDTVLRLLLVDGRPQTRLPFLDVHSPLRAQDRAGIAQPGRYVRQVVRDVVLLEAPSALANPLLEVAPFVDWSGFASLEAYRAWLSARNKGLVKDRERRARALAAQHGALVFTADDQGEDVLPFAQHWKSRQLIATGHPNYFADPRTLQFFAALRARGVLQVSTIRASGTLVSVWIGYIADAVWSGWVFTYDPAFKKFSAGHQLLSRMLEESFARGHREFDFSEGGEEYKLQYATHARLLGEAGRLPLKRRLVALSKQVLHAASPKLLTVVQAWSRGTGRAAKPAS